MCGRYAQYLPPEAIVRLFRALNATPNHAASWNVAPTQDALVIRCHPDTGERHADLLTWGLVPHFTKDLKAARRPINARAETVAPAADVTLGVARSASAAGETAAASTPVTVKPFPAEQRDEFPVSAGQPRDHRQHSAVGLLDY